MKAYGIRASIVLFYGVLVLVGGIIGHLKAGSRASLIMGSIFAVLLITSAVLMFKKQVQGSAIAMILSVVLAAFFSYRFLLSYHFMPAGMMAVISLIVAVMLILTRKKTS